MYRIVFLCDIYTDTVFLCLYINVYIYEYLSMYIYIKVHTFKVVIL